MRPCHCACRRSRCRRVWMAAITAAVAASPASGFMSAPKRTITWFSTTSFRIAIPSRRAASRRASRAARQCRSTMAAMPSRPRCRSIAQAAKPPRPARELGHEMRGIALADGDRRQIARGRDGISRARRPVARWRRVHRANAQDRSNPAPAAARFRPACVRPAPAGQRPMVPAAKSRGPSRAAESVDHAWPGSGSQSLKTIGQSL